MPVKLRPSPPPHRNRQGGLFFWPTKTKVQRLLQNQVQIDFDNEHDDFCDENCNNFDDSGDENDQKTDKYHGFLVKIYPLRHLHLVKKGPKQPGNAHLK